MGNVHQLVHQEQRSEEASLWIAKLERGLSPEEERKLRRWISADTKNRAELLAFAQLWDRMDALSKLSDVIPHPDVQSTKRQLALAASVILATAISVLLLLTNNDAKTPVEVAHHDEARYETPVGDQSTVHLNDGSIVQLNTDTRLDVSMLPGQRVLTLERGEIHISVAHDPDRPFRVLVGDRVIEAVGTSFNVRIDDENQELELIVTEGRVRVGISPGAANRIADYIPLVEYVSENERLRLDDPLVRTVENLKPDEIEVSLSWRDCGFNRWTQHIG